MSAILETIARRPPRSSGPVVSGKELKFAPAKAGLLGQVGDIEQGQSPYARFVVCTRDVDGSGDLMEPKGCLPYLKRFERNPVWFYDHYDPDGQHRLKFPIGKADGPAGQAGKLDITVEDDRIELGCWFTRATREARDVYQLVKGKFLRCPSISFLPRYAEKLRTGGLHYFEWELTEVSIVGVPDNPMTGTLEIKSLESPRLRKSWSRGVTINKDQAMPTETFAAVQFSKKSWTKQQAQKFLKAQGLDGSLLEELDGALVYHQAGCSAADWGVKKKLDKGVIAIAKAVKKDADGDDDGDTDTDTDAADAKNAEGTADAAKSDETPATDKDAADDGEKVDKSEAEADNDAPAAIPPGASTLKDLFGHHKGVHDYCTQMKAFNEHPDVVKGLDEQIGHAQAQMDSIKNLATKAYPDVNFDKLVASDPGADEHDAETGHNDQNMPTDKQAEQKRLGQAVAKRMTAKHRSICNDAAEHLEEAAQKEQSKCMKSAHLFHAKCLKDLIAQHNTPTDIRTDQAPTKDLDGDDNDDDAEVAKALKSLGAAVTKKAA